MSESSARAWSGLPRGVLVLSAAAAAVIVTIGARQLGWLLAPMLLAMVLVILVHPVHAALLQRQRLDPPIDVGRVRTSQAVADSADGDSDT